MLLSQYGIYASGILLLVLFYSTSQLLSRRHSQEGDRSTMHKYCEFFKLSGRFQPLIPLTRKVVLSQISVPDLCLVECVLPLKGKTVLIVAYLFLF